MNLQADPRILIVDDDPIMASVLKMVLESKFSAEVTLAGDCASARQALADSVFDLITMDYELPDGNGIDLMEEIVSRVGHLPVVMVTGKGDEKTAARAFLVGASGYVTKDQKINTMLVSAVQNVLEQAHSRKLQSDSEIRYRRLFEAARDGILILDADTGQIEDANPYMVEILGYSLEEFIGKQLWEIGPFKDAGVSVKAFEELKDKRYIRYENLPLQAKDGREVDVEFVSNIYVSDHREVIQCNIRDVTVRFQVEGRRNLAADILMILNRSAGSKDAIKQLLDLIKDFTGMEAVGIRLQEGSDFPYYEKNGFPGSFLEVENYLCSYSKDRELLRDEQGRPVLECMCGDVIRGRTDPSRYFFTKGGSFWHNSTTHLLATTTIEDRQGMTRNHCNTAGYESVAMIPLRSGDEIIGLIHLADHRKDMFTLDLIEFLEEVGLSIGIAIIRKEYKERIERANHELDVFAHTVSHDLKGPLAAASSAGDLLKVFVSIPGTEETASKVLELSEIIFSSINKAFTLINDILELAQAGQFPVVVEAVNVGEVVEKILEERAGIIVEKGIEARVSKDLGRVTANATHVYQVFSNLIGNAVKHNDSISPEIEVTCLGKEGSGTRYLVRDNGSGIPPDDMENIFTPFFKGKSGDTGIGLSTAEKIIKLYGGSIRAYNDNGACFEFVIGTPVWKT